MRFSSSFRVCGSVFAIAITLSGCAFLIPENASAPRYNSITGERRAPKLNSTPANGAQSAVDANGYAAIPTASGKPALYSENETPQPYVNPYPSDTREKSAAAATEEKRRMPTENVNQMMAMGSRSSYPELSTVPARPAMTCKASTGEELSKVRLELENDRTNADLIRDQLSRDAAAEPPITMPTPPDMPAAAQAAPTNAPATEPASSPANHAVTKPISYLPPVAQPPASGIQVSDLLPNTALPAANKPFALVAPEVPQGIINIRFIPRPALPQPLLPASAGGFNPMAEAAAQQQVFLLPAKAPAATPAHQAGAATILLTPPEKPKATHNAAMALDATAHAALAPAAGSEASVVFNPANETAVADSPVATNFVVSELGERFLPSSRYEVKR